MNPAQQVENTMVRPIIEYRAPRLGICACGCKESITLEYEYIRWDDQYFTDRSHLIRYMKENLGLEEAG